MEELLNYKKKISRNPYDAKSLVGLGLYYLSSKQPLKAREAFEKLLSINPCDKSIKDLLSLTEDKNYRGFRQINNFAILSSPAAPPALIEELIMLADKHWLNLSDYLGKSGDFWVLIEVDPAYWPVARIETFERPLLPKIALDQSRIKEDILIHEMVHLLEFNFNRFLTEGLAVALQYKFSSSISWPFENRAAREVLNENRPALIPLEMLALETNRQLNYYSPKNLGSLSSRLAYLQSGSFVGFLIDKHGLDKVGALLKVLDNPSLEGEEILKSYATVFGQSFSALKNKWLEDLDLIDFKKEAAALNQSRQKMIERLLEAEKSYDFASLIKSRDFFLELIRRDNGLVQDFYYLSRIYFDLSNTPEVENKNEEILALIEQAVINAKKAIEKEDNFSDAHRVLGESYSKMIRLKGDLSGIKYGPRAEKEVQKACRLDPDNFMAFLALGRIKLFTPILFGGDLKEARKLFEQVIEKAPCFSGGYTWLGISYCEENGDLAKTYLARALELNPLDRLAQKNLEALPLALLS